MTSCILYLTSDLSVLDQISLTSRAELSSLVLQDSLYHCICRPIDQSTNRLVTMPADLDIKKGSTASEDVCCMNTITYHKRPTDFSFFEQASETAPAELTTVVDELLNQLSTKFSNISTELIAKSMRTLSLAQ